MIEIWNPSSTAKEPEWSTWDQESVAWIPESRTISLVFSTFALQPHVHHSFLSEKLHYLLCSFCSFCQDCSFGLKLMCPLQGKLVYVSAFYLKDLFYIFIHARLSQLILAHVLYLLFCKFVKLFDWMLQVSEGTDDAATSYLVHLLSDLNTLLKKVSSNVRHQGDNSCGYIKPLSCRIGPVGLGKI